jgi:hypothetical protein
MRTAMILRALDGDPGCWRNRQPNEILFTAQRDDGGSFNTIVPGGMRVQLLAPASRTLPVTSVIRDGEVFRAQLARYDDEAPIHSGVFLASVLAIVTIPGGEFTGTAIASVPIDEDLPAIPRPQENPKSA